jgi:arginine decarboxylase
MPSYYEFVKQSAGFPQSDFDVIEDELYFHNINLMEMLETYGTPLKFTFLPAISNKIKEARLLFQQAMLKNDYRGRYHYGYGLKSAHFKYVLEEVLKNDICLATSSAFEMTVVDALQKKAALAKENTVLCNGFKTAPYIQAIINMLQDGFKNIIPVLDNRDEFNHYKDEPDLCCNLGLRIASEEQPNALFYTSRLGIRINEVIDFYDHKIASHPNFKLTVLCFFISSGISDTLYYWNELEKYVTLYCKLKKVNEHLTALNIGGGMPFKDSLTCDFDYAHMIQEIISRVKSICTAHQVLEPDIITEFGRFTVSEASGIIFKVLGRKQQNDREKWLMVDGSFITNLPDVWAQQQKFILLPVNNWGAEYERVNLGGITCDGDDYYNQEVHGNDVFMPKTRKVQYLSFFHTGSCQEALSGHGGIHHCLLPSPKHIIIRRKRDETYHYEVFAEEQNSKQAMKILGYL